jgi:hypothetical protein
LAVSLIDWDNPPRLSFRRRVPRDLDALARTHAKRVKRKGSKAHATNKERSALEREKAKKRAKLADRRSDERKSYLERVRAYWRGEGDHP